MIAIEGLTFTYAEGFDGFRLGPVELSLLPGRVYGWQGHNGSGKSTLASILAKQRNGYSGNISGLPDRILYFQQHVALNIFPDLTVGEHIELCRDEKRRGEILTAFPSLREHSRKYPDTLSGGQLQRLAFSLALIRDFDLYIFDEVTNHLDPATVNLVGTTMRNLLAHRPQATIVSISHDHNFLGRFADSICVFQEGRVMETIVAK